MTNIDPSNIRYSEIPFEKVECYLKKIPFYCTNPHYKEHRFTEQLNSGGVWYGQFCGDLLLSMSVIVYNISGLQDLLCTEIQSIVNGHASGLIRFMLSDNLRNNNHMKAFMLVSVNSQYHFLLKLYRIFAKRFNLGETIFQKNGVTVHLFMICPENEKAANIAAYQNYISL